MFETSGSQIFSVRILKGRYVCSEDGALPQGLAEHGGAAVFLSLSPHEVVTAKTSWQKFPRVFDVRYYWYPLLAS